MQVLPTKLIIPLALLQVVSTTSKNIFKSYWFILNTIKNIIQNQYQKLASTQKILT